MGTGLICVQIDGADSGICLKDQAVYNVIMSYRIPRLNYRLDETCFACRQKVDNLILQM
jgi:hypothetical protein